MKKILLFFMATLAACAQTKEKAFSKTDYPASKYTVKADAFDFSGFKVELIQARLRDTKTYDSTAAYCRVWLTVKKGNATIDHFFLNDCEALGGCSGIYVSEAQPRKDYLILSKFGDYDGRILIIDVSGKIKSFFGGICYVSPDTDYLFSSYDSDLSGLTVFDLSKNKVLFTTDNLPVYLADFYYLDGNYFAIVSDDAKKANQTNIQTYDFKANKLVASIVADSYIAKAKPLKSYNVPDYGPCNCGQTKK